MFALNVSALSLNLRWPHVARERGASGLVSAQAGSSPICSASAIHAMQTPEQRQSFLPVTTTIFAGP